MVAEDMLDDIPGEKADDDEEEEKPVDDERRLGRDGLEVSRH